MQPLGGMSQPGVCALKFTDITNSALIFSFSFFFELSLLPLRWQLIAPKLAPSGFSQQTAALWQEDTGLQNLAAVNTKSNMFFFFF